MSMNVCWHVCMPNICMPDARRGEKRTSDPSNFGSGGMDSCKPPRGYGKPNPGPPQQHHILLTAKHLLPHRFLTQNVTYYLNRMFDPVGSLSVFFSHSYL